MSFKLISSPSPKVSELSQTGSQTPALASAHAQQEYPTRKAGQLLSLYRRGDAQDPETYVAGLGAVLSEYPAEVIDYVCDPRTGLARRLKFLPTIAEVAEACDQRMEYVRTLETGIRRQRATLANPNASEHAKQQAQQWLDRFDPQRKNEFRQDE